MITLCLATIGASKAIAEEGADANGCPARPQLQTNDPLESLLTRVQCGTQVGVTKVFSPDGQILFTKGLDVDTHAPIGRHHRDAIFGALGVDPNQAPAMAQDIMANYERLPRAASLAMLGVIASGSPPNQAQILDFLCCHLEGPASNDRERVLVRQAGLALAVAEPLNPRTVERAANFFASVNNRWLEYPMIELFKFHGDYVASLGGCARICQMIRQSPSFYAEQLLSSIGTPGAYSNSGYSANYAATYPAAPPPVQARAVAPPQQMVVAEEDEESDVPVDYVEQSPGSYVRNPPQYVSAPQAYAHAPQYAPRQQYAAPAYAPNYTP